MLELSDKSNRGDCTIKKFGKKSDGNDDDEGGYLGAISLTQWTRRRMVE
jgi:hypothetical protein